MDDVHIRRLVLIKALYDEGVKQSKKPVPHQYFSILTFHDSVEMFMALASKKYNVKVKVGFMSYWENLKDEVQEGYPSQEVSMENLNKTRNSFKHNGVPPSPEEIEGIRAYVTNFFVENTPVFFGIGFNDISLLSLIKNKRIRELLIEAEQLLDDRNVDKSLLRSKAAFSYMQKKLGETDRRYQRYCQISSSLKYAHNPLGEFDPERVFDLLGMEIENLYHMLFQIGLGIDQFNVARFLSITPPVQWNGEEYSYQKPIYKNEEYSEDDARFCIDFVIETIISLQARGIEFNRDI